MLTKFGKISSFWGTSSPRPPTQPRALALGIKLYAYTINCKFLTPFSLLHLGQFAHSFQHIKYVYIYTTLQPFSISSKNSLFLYLIHYLFKKVAGIPVTGLLHPSHCFLF